MTPAEIVTCLERIKEASLNPNVHERTRRRHAEDALEALADEIKLGVQTGRRDGQSNDLEVVEGRLRMIVAELRQPSTDDRCRRRRAVSDIHGLISDIRADIEAEGRAVALAAAKVEQAARRDEMALAAIETSEAAERALAGFQRGPKTHRRSSVPR